MLRALPGFKRCLKQGGFLQARRFAQDAPQSAVQDILVPSEGLIVLDGWVSSVCRDCQALLYMFLYTSLSSSCSTLLPRTDTLVLVRPSCVLGACRYDAKGFTAAGARVEGAIMCTGGLLTEWQGVHRLADITVDSLALMFAVKPAPGALSLPALCFFASLFPVLALSSHHTHHRLAGVAELALCCLFLCFRCFAWFLLSGVDC